MTMYLRNILGNLPKTVKSTAQDLWDRQQFAPISPVQRGPNGDIQLCAAACLAAASIKVRSGDDAAGEFARNLANTGDRDFVRSEFEHLGLSRETCDQVFQRNDAYLTPLDRKSGIARLFA